MSIATQNQRITALEHHLRTQPQWVKIGEASKALNQTCSNLRKKANNGTLRIGKEWKWKDWKKTERLFHIENIKKREGRW